MSHILMINLGTGNPEKPPLGYDRTTYRFEDGCEVETPVAGLALWKYLVISDRAPVSVRFAVTPEAWEGKEIPLREEIEHLALDPSVLGPPLMVRIPRTLADLWEVLPGLESWAGEHGSGETPPVLHIDLTHAWRAIPISQPWLALFLQRLGLIETGVMGYGAYVPNQGPTSYIDLAAVMELAEWAAGVRDFERYGRAGTLRELMGERRQEWRKKVYLTREAPEARGALEHLQRLVNAAGAMEAYLPAGLPVELGLEVGGRLKASSAEDVARAVDQLIPGTAPLGRRLHKAASRFALRDSAPAKGKKDQRVHLSDGEIERQLGLVEYWTQLGAVGDALRVLRELIVNRVVLAYGVKQGWLERAPRERAEGVLNGIRPGRENPGYSTLPSGLRKLGGLWHEVSEERNAFAHAGMKPDWVDPSARRDRLEKFVQRFRELHGDEEVWQQLIARKPERT